MWDFVRKPRKTNIAFQGGRTTGTIGPLPGHAEARGASAAVHRPTVSSLPFWTMPFSTSEEQHRPRLFKDE
jgi:hypothetical protein